MSTTLCLNKNWQPIRLISKFSSIGKLYCGVVEAIVVRDGKFFQFDFDEWLKVSLDDSFWPSDQLFVQATRQRIAAPRVVRCLNYDKVPRSSLRLGKRAIYLRDDHTCYLCGKKFGESSLSIDHVVPVSKGGKTIWTNVVTCCKSCNHSKGDKTLEELGKKPKFLPYKPESDGPVAKIKLQTKAILEDWRAFGF